MFRKYLFYLKKSDWLLSLVAFFLVAFGLMGIYSSEVTAADSDLLNYKKQIVFFGIGIFLMIFFSLLDYRYLNTYGFVFYGLGILLLLFVLFFGTIVSGTKGWIVLFGDQVFQPVEIIKIIMIIIISKFFSKWRSEVKSLKNLFQIFGIAGVLILLIFLQPDFGSAFILLAIFFGMLLLTKVKKSYIIWIVVLVAIVSIFSWAFILQDYQHDRVLTFLDPDRDPWGSGYNIKQSIISVGSGQFFGRGLSLGPQSRLNFLPAQETDFIFAVIAEELGFMGSLFLIGLIIFLIYRLFRVCRLARDDFGLFLVSGIIIYLFSQSLLNIGMNIGVLPIAGVPLPFVSYGGTSMIASFIMLGIAHSVFIRRGITAQG
ncbi:MAG: rod shape-determining protein RodA [Candidatus Kerfeldbacteria bacterium]